MKVPIKGDINYLIECYDEALKVKEEDMKQYLISERMSCGVCKKLFHSKNAKKISKLGFNIIGKNKIVFQGEIISPYICYWFQLPRNLKKYSEIIKSLEARKLVLEEILKTL